MTEWEEINYENVPDWAKTTLDVKTGGHPDIGVTQNVAYAKGKHYIYKVVFKVSFWSGLKDTYYRKLRRKWIDKEINTNTE